MTGISKVRIVYIIPTMKRAGPIVVLYNLIKHLDREHYEPMIITLFSEHTDSMLHDFRDLDIAVDMLGLSKVGWIYTGTRALRNQIIRLQPDIVHSHAFQPDVLLSRCEIGPPRISTLHCDMYVFYPIDYGVWGYPVAWTHLRCLNRFEVVVTCSETLRKKFSSKLKTTVVAIQNGVDEQEFCNASSEDKAALREKLHLPLDKRIFISTGLLSDRKDPLVSIKAFLQFNEENRCAFVLLGEGPLAGKCREMCDGRSDAILRGKVANVREYLGAADFFISASHSEGLPMAVMEALALGLPCVLSDIPSHREIFQSSPGPAFFFPAGDLSCLTQCLRDIVGSEYDELSREAQGIISSRFNAGRVTKEYQDLYCSLVGQKKVRGIPS